MAGGDDRIMKLMQKPAKSSAPRDFALAPGQSTVSLNFTQL